MKRHWKGPSAITPAITTSRSASRCLPSSASPCGATRSTTAPTPASRRLVRRLAGVGAVVDRVAPHGDALDGKHREARLLGVITGVIAEGPCEGRFIGVNHALQDNLRARGHLQI